MAKKMKYCVSIHGGQSPARRRVVEAFGPRTALALAVEALDLPPRYEHMPRERATTDAYQGSAYSASPDSLFPCAFVYEVQDDAPTGNWSAPFCPTRDYGVKGTANGGHARPAYQRTDARMADKARVLPPDAADEIRRLSAEVQRLRKVSASKGEDIARLTEELADLFIRNADLKDRNARQERIIRAAQSALVGRGID